MEPVLSVARSQLRRFRRMSHSSISTSRLCRTYTSSTVCTSCRSRAWKHSNTIKPARRWESQAAAATSRQTIETPLKKAVPRTHYELFPQTFPKGPPPAGPFRVDFSKLRREFLQLQAVAHPDRHPQELKARAEATSSLINEAYKTLQSPLLRAQYLLLQRGYDLAQDETAKTDDPELLMEVLDTREEIEDAEVEGDLSELKLDNCERIRISEDILEKAFGEDDLEMAKAEAIRLRYWVNIKESLHSWEKGKPVVLVH